MGHMFFDFGDFRQYEWSLDWFFEKSFNPVESVDGRFFRHRVFFDTGIVCQRSFNNTGGKGYASVAHIRWQWFRNAKSFWDSRTNPDVWTPAKRKDSNPQNPQVT